MQNEEKKYPEPTVGALIINKEGKILLAKGKKWGDRYTIPGGHVEIGESLEEAIKREVREEMGLDVEIITKLGFGESIYSEEFHKKKHFVFIDFLCKYEGDSEKVATNREFQGKFVWVPIEEALKLNLFHGAKLIIDDYKKYNEAQKYLDSWKRCQADFENYKKDQAKRQEEFAKFAKMDVISQILPVLDNFEISLAHVPEEKKENKWVEGIIYIKKQLEDALKNNGVEEISVKTGDKFDPEIHESVGGEGKKQKVAKIIQKGYRMNGKMLRAARVEVG